MCIITGDININLLEYNSTDVQDYLTTFSSHNFLPLIKIPTRITDHSATLIDHLFVRFPRKLIDSPTIAGNILIDFTDHLPIFCAINSTHANPGTERPYIRKFTERNMNAFKEIMSNLNWDHLLNDLDTESKVDILYTNIYKAYDYCFPLTKLSRKRAKDKLWITPGLKISIKNGTYCIVRNSENQLPLILVIIERMQIY
jgi:hypothetical protein